MSNYQPFLISEFKTGLYDYLKPWIRPADAFEPLTNAFVYRGILQKRNGSTIFGEQLDDGLPVMGIMQYQNESNGQISLIVASEDYLYYFTPGTTPDSGTFTKIVTVQDSQFWSGTAAAAGNPHPLNMFWKDIVVSSVSMIGRAPGQPDTTITFDATDNQVGSGGIFAAGGSINRTTGIASINFAAGPFPNASITVTLTLSGTTPYFTGNISNFFNWTNWQPTSELTATTKSYLYMVNGVDPVTLVNADSIPYMTRPGFYTNSAGTTYISTALDVKTYANRLLLLRPTVSPNTTPANQDIAYSALYSPFNFVADVAGNGGAISAATGDRIISAEFLRDNLIVAFTNSTWTFQVTGLKDPPFIFRKISVARSAQCPYASVPYDERVTNLGNTGFYATDGVNVQRFDLQIIDWYETQISQQYANQDFSQRYDNTNQTWMFYPSAVDTFPIVDTVAPGSDQTLIYNYLENTWATFKNSFPMTCLGFFYVPEGTTWADLEQSWQDTDSAWNSYGFQSSGRVLLGGDTHGNVYHLDNPSAVLDGMKDVVTQQIAVGNGGTNYSGTLPFAYYPITIGTFAPTDGIETFVDNGDGTLTGSAGGAGTINYLTGSWTLTFFANVPISTLIVADYIVPGTSFNIDVKTTRWNPFMQTGQKTQFGYIDVFYNVASVDPANPIQIFLNFYVDNSNEIAAQRTLTLDGPIASALDVLATGNGGSSYSGSISGVYIIPKSFDVSVTTSAGIESFVDDGNGNLSGDLGDYGTVVYQTGTWTLTFVSGRTVPTGNPITADYEYNDTDAYNWKRIYCNLMGEFIQIDFDPSEDSYFEILGFVLWARPAGRLTP